MINGLKSDELKSLLEDCLKDGVTAQDLLNNEWLKSTGNDADQIDSLFNQSQTVNFRGLANQ
jgi:hypothetical protein